MARKMDDRERLCQDRSQYFPRYFQSRTISVSDYTAYFEEKRSYTSIFDLYTVTRYGAYRYPSRSAKSVGKGRLVNILVLEIPTLLLLG